MSHLFKRFRRDIVGLVWLATAIFMALSLFSYSPSDPSFNSIGKGLDVQNFCGYIGSFLADLLYQVFGMATWILVLGSMRLAIKSFKGDQLQITKLRWLWAGLLLINIATLISLYFPQATMFSNEIHIGGLIGQTLSRSLQKAFNFWGVAVILWTATTVFIVFYTEKSIQELFKSPVGWMSLLSYKIREKAQFEEAKVQFIESLKRLKNRPRSKIIEQPSMEIQRGDGPKLFKLTQENRGHQASPTDSRESREIFIDEPVIFKDESERGPTISGFFAKNAKAKKLLKSKIKTPNRIENWTLPKIDLLGDPPLSLNKLDEKEIKQKAKILTDKLAQFSVRGQVVGVKPGPAITMFEFKPAADVKISKITDLADDLSLALSSESVRIIAPIPGRDVVGIETSNSHREIVYLKDILNHEPFWQNEIHLPLAVGRQADGSPKVVDLCKMPHMLVAGSTGSGKSVFVVSLLSALLFRHSPKTLRLILVDPKQVDLAAFNDIPHLLIPPVRDTKKATSALKFAIREMNKRYRSLSKFGARGLEAFNQKVEKLDGSQVKGHRQFNEELPGGENDQESYYFTPQPYIVIIVEEFGDLMAVDKSNVEQAVVRLAQMARAAGIHLILAMQSPRKDVVTGLIKTNIPGRVSFKVASKMDSRIILDESGAERLLTRGDMLFHSPGVAKPSRHHGAYLNEDEINQLTQFWRNQGEPVYDELAMQVLEGSGGGFDLATASNMGEDNDFDDRYDEVLAYVSTLKEVSASLIQRKFRLGYPRAARIIETFESEGVVGPANGSKPRKVLISHFK